MFISTTDCITFKIQRAQQCLVGIANLTARVTKPYFRGGLGLVAPVVLKRENDSVSRNKDPRGC